MPYTQFGHKILFNFPTKFPFPLHHFTVSFLTVWPPNMIFFSFRISSSSSSFAFLLLLLLSPSLTDANDDGSSLFFRRNAKWINLPSGGGSLVSGRGNFRPGFHSSLRSQSLMAEPLFAIKKSGPPLSSFAMFDRDGFGGGDPIMAAFARRR